MATSDFCAQWKVEGIVWQDGDLDAPRIAQASYRAACETFLILCAGAWKAGTHDAWRERPMIQMRTFYFQLCLAWVRSDAKHHWELRDVPDWAKMTDAEKCVRPGHTRAAREVAPARLLADRRERLVCLMAELADFATGEIARIDRRRANRLMGVLRMERTGLDNYITGDSPYVRSG